MMIYRNWQFEPVCDQTTVTIRFVTPDGRRGRLSTLCFASEAQAVTFMQRYIDRLEDGERNAELSPQGNGSFRSAF